MPPSISASYIQFSTSSYSAGADLLVVGDLDAAAHRHQQEEVQRLRVQLLGQRQRLRHLVDVVARDRGVDLVGHADFAQVFHAGEDLSKAPAPRKMSCVAASAPSKLMLTRRTPLSLISRATVGVDQRAVGGQRDDQPGVAGVAGDVEDVGPEERFAAGQDKDRPGKGGDLVDQVKGFVGGQVLGQQLVGHGDAAAVDAGQVAAGGRFPENQARRRIR